MGDRSTSVRRSFGPFAIGRLVAGIAGLAVLALLVAVVAGWRPSLNPFAERTVDRSPPALLQSLEDLHEYRAASAHFEVIVDLDKEAKFLPSSVRGQRTLFVGVGTVDGSVDFSRLGQKAVTVSPDRRTVTVTLPHAVLSPPRLDPANSYVVARQEGILDRIGNFFGGTQNDQKLYVLASEKMTTSARKDGSVLTLAEQNTATMLRGLLGALGFTTVTVSYSGPAGK